jgi:hypothetical protein
LGNDSTPKTVQEWDYSLSNGSEQQRWDSQITLGCMNFCY